MNYLKYQIKYVSSYLVSCFVAIFTLFSKLFIYFDECRVRMINFIPLLLILEYPTTSNDFKPSDSANPLYSSCPFPRRNIVLKRFARDVTNRFKKLEIRLSSYRFSIAWSFQCDVSDGNRMNGSNSLTCDWKLDLNLLWNVLHWYCPLAWNALKEINLLYWRFYWRLL